MTESLIRSTLCGMCGRYTRTTESAYFAERVSAPSNSSEPPRYNIAPSQPSLLAREHPASGARELVSLKWGLVPHWANDAKIAYKTINARAESVATKPAFRDSFRARRCLVAADGWYEWKVTDTGKVPMLVRRISPHGELLPCFFAGLWASWRDPARLEDPLETFTILTREASPALTPVHDRMPVIMPDHLFGAWLDRRLTQPDAITEIIAGAVVDGFVFHPVSTRVNTPRNDDRECLVAVNQ